MPFFDVLPGVLKTDAARNRSCLDWLRADLENAHAESVSDAEQSP
jgi:hypothetical protein